MKKTLIFALLVGVAFTWGSCKKINNYAGGRVSEYIPIFDLRDVYRGADVKLTKDAMYGSDRIGGMVVSDYSGNNLPTGYLLVQDKRRLNKQRGIAINLGAAAANYKSGDSVTVVLEGGTLTRKDNILQVTGLTTANVTRHSSGNTVVPAQAAASLILANPGDYESTLVGIVEGTFDPVPTPTDVLQGDKVVNDGFDNIILHTEATATFAQNKLAASANYFGIVYTTTGTDGKLIPQVRLRTGTDIQTLSSDVVITPLVISGFISDVIGGDGNYEYVQFLATRDINFAVTPYSLVFCNNAGAAIPGGFPVNGWASGGGQVTPTAIQFRTYKINITSGSVKKGEFCYVGGTTRMINGSGSTPMTTSNWVRMINSTTTDGDGFGTRYSGLMANSGNAWGMALFAGTTVTKETVPVDCIFMHTGGSLFQAPTSGYKVGNTDWYRTVNPITLVPQPYNRQGTNTMALTYSPSDLGYFYKLGGIYNSRLNKWVKARAQQTVILSKTSALTEIETEFPAGVVVTTVKD